MTGAELAAWARKILAEVSDPMFPVRLAAEQARRTDPWRWYCRLCGATGEAPERPERDAAAVAHLTETPCGRHGVGTSAESGRLLHVWSYGAPSLMN
jgi:hypothetical protein